MAPKDKGFYAGFAVQSPFDPYDRKRALKISFGRCFDNMLYDKRFESLESILVGLLDSCNDRMRANTVLGIKGEFLPYMTKICGNLSIVFNDDWKERE
jgi:hypothetical protein